MKAAPFEHHEPSTVDEAVGLLDDHDGATVLAGGQSLVPVMRFRLAEPDAIVDLNGIDSLDYLREDDGYLRLGALCRHADVEDADLVADRYGAFADAAPQIGDPQIRNRGTVVGSLAQADPKGDWGTVLLAHDGEVVVRSSEGERAIPAEDFFLLPYDTAMDEDELAVEARVPTTRDSEGSAYRKLKRKTGDYAMVGVAARLDLAEDGTVADAAIALTSVDITNVRSPEAEAVLEGSEPTTDRIVEASEAAAAEANPESDDHGGAEYKRNMVRVQSQKALADALERAREA